MWELFHVSSFKPHCLIVLSYSRLQQRISYQIGGSGLQAPLIDKQYLLSLTLSLTSILFLPYFAPISIQICYLLLVMLISFAGGSVVNA